MKVHNDKMVTQWELQKKLYPQHTDSLVTTGCSMTERELKTSHTIGHDMEESTRRQTRKAT